MPRLAGNDGMEQHKVSGSNFGFSAARIENLGATEYTGVNIDIDITGSVDGFQNELRKMLITAVEACKKSPRSDNLLLRVTTFNSLVGVKELHGFKLLSEIDPNAYPEFHPDGYTNLYDAGFTGIGGLITYAEQLKANDFLVNGIYIGITDGYDNQSRATPAMIRKEIEEARKEEKLESLLSILIGINATQYVSKLKEYQAEAGFDQYIDAGDATPGKLAKLAAFVSHSVSSTSQALGTGGPSQNISATI